MRFDLTSSVANSKSMDVRMIVARAIKKGCSYEEAAHLAGVGRASVSRWMRRLRETGSLEPKPPGGGNVSPMSEALIYILVELIQEKPNLTDGELTVLFAQKTGVDVCPTTVRRALQRVGFSRKKVRTAQERFRPDDVEKRANTRARYVSRYDSPTREAYLLTQKVP